MTRISHHAYSPQYPCPYLPELLATTESMLILQPTSMETQIFLEHGWRHFGAEYFRPVCAGCAECVSLRIPVATFQPSRSQRRARRKCSHLRIVEGVPAADSARLQLFLAWHRNREQARGWQENITDEETYDMQFCFPNESAREFAYYDGDRLVAIDLVDETPNSFSSVYFYFDPACHHLSLGKASVVFEMEIAKAKGKNHLYLGYGVRGCASLNYKLDFAPHERLIGRPNLDEPAVWTA